MRVLVTGAAGFVGRRLCRRLVEDGHQVVAATREPRDFGKRIHNEVIGDLRQVRKWPSLEGCDAVVHTAAHVHRMDNAADDERLFREVNVDATARIASDAADLGVGRLVFLSTVKVHGEATGGRPIVETSPIAPHDAYARSKAEAEVVLRESAIQSVVIRPPLIYGPGVGANFLLLMRAISKRRPMPLGGLVTNRRSLVFVENVVDAIVCCLTSPSVDSRAYLVRDGEDVSTASLVRRIADALGVRPRLISVPSGMLSLAGSLTGRRESVRRLVESLQIDDTTIRRELGWSPPFTLDEGLKATAQFFLKEGGA